MKKEIVNIGGKDYAPILVSFGECCINCDIGQRKCHFQCHYFEDSEDEPVALKEVRHEAKLTLWQRIKNSKWFMPIESDLPF